MALSDNSVGELHWWVNNIQQACRHITTTYPYLTICINVSLTGRGVTDKVNSGGEFWDNEETTNMNVLELKAIFCSIKIYCKNYVFKHFKVMRDNLTAVFHHNHIGRQKYKG